MKLRPLGKRILVRRQPKETTTTGGIVLPGAGEETNRGEIVSVGPGVRLGKRRDGHRITACWR